MAVTGILVDENSSATCHADLYRRERTSVTATSSGIFPIIYNVGSMLRYRLSYHDNNAAGIVTLNNHSGKPLGGTGRKPLILPPIDATYPSARILNVTIPLL